jgi:sensor c-di-GMP phosphodiesterase-like protein
MNSVIAERLELQTLLRKAVEESEFVLLYQPKVDLISDASPGWKRCCASKR